MKFRIYEEAGVKEYWVIFPKTKIVRVFLLQENGRFDSGVDYAPPAKLPMQTLPGLLVDLEELFDV